MTSAALAVVLVAVVVIVRNSLPDIGPIIRTADTFPAPTSWTLATAITEPATLTCWGGNRCPSENRRWTVPAHTTLEDFRALLDTTPWDLTQSPACTREPSTVGDVRRCSAKGVVDGIYISVSYSSSEPEGANDGSVNLTVHYP